MDKFMIAGEEIKPGESKRIEIATVPLYTGTNMNIPVFVKRGKRKGPTLLVSAAIHGDELNGIEIISRVINSKALNSIRGTLVAVPFVNGYGVLNQSRYLPDRRDLNRCFPGSATGTLASRIAHRFLNEVVAKCDYGIDLHTGAIHRTNLPQIRANLDDEETLAMAKAFGVPVLINANLRDGSLRQCADEVGVKILLYEAGEALRFDELSIRAGFKGVINVMRHLGLLNRSRSKSAPVEPFVARQTGWVRAPDSGFVLHRAQLGDLVAKGELLATIKDPFGQTVSDVRSNAEGVIIGKQNIPLAQAGEAMYHIAYFRKPDDVAENIEILQDNLFSD